jgi:hypothetical protein
MHAVSVSPHVRFAEDRLMEACEALAKVTAEDCLDDDRLAISKAFDMIYVAMRVLSSCGGPAMMVGDLDAKCGQCGHQRSSVAHAQACG